MKTFLHLVFVLSLFTRYIQCDDKTRFELVNANNQFTLDLLKSVYTSGKNVIFSPYSISVAVAMTSLGARGETLAQVDTAFHFDKVKKLSPHTKEPHEEFKNLLLLNTKENQSHTISTTNRLFSSAQVDILSPFMEAVQKYYGASIGKVNFSLGKGEKMINKWVKEQTKHRIKELFKPHSLDKSTLLVLVNTIYFKGQWETEFIPDLTEEDNFHVTSSLTKKAMLMNAVDVPCYYHKDEEQNWDVIELPYQGKNASMVILLPAQDDMSNFITYLTPRIVNYLIYKMEEKLMRVAIPKFTLKIEYDLKDHLMKLGVTDLFDVRADLSGVSRRQINVSKIRHASFIEVDEQGAKAASATGTDLHEKSFGDDNTFKADRPFLFFIMDNVPSRRILFAGVFSTPQSR